MNKAITEGVLLMPPVFANGLGVWSSGDGTPGSGTYANASNAAFVPADQDFGGALELAKTQSVQRLRYMGETPLLPGCYLKVTVRIKAISGNLPSVRISGYPGGAGGGKIGGVPEFSVAVPLTSYGEVVEVSAIIGGGDRRGVDMVWGPAAVYGHLGIDLVGQNGGLVRIDDIRVEDISSVFLSDIVATVDVRDYGAIGDGTTDDTAAFEAANNASSGRTVLVPAGIFRLEGSVTFDAPTRFEGTVRMADDAVLLLRQNYDLANYIDAFGNEELAFKKAFQALLNNADHESLDLSGRKVNVTAPIDMQAAVGNRTSYGTRRVIHNGQLLAASDGDWATETVVASGTYNTNSTRTLSNVSNIANIPVGAHVSGAGVGREVYVRSKNVAANEITLNAALHDAEGTQNFTFRRFKYLLDFSGFTVLSKFALHDIEFQCSGVSSGIMLAPAGTIFSVKDCFITAPKDRGITSSGGGCQGMFVERCQFLSSEDQLNVPQRVSIALNTNANDVKLRNNRATRFRHFAILAGQNNLVTGNHFFQGDTVAGGVRSAGLVLAAQHTSSIVSHNYVDNCFIEWTNERDPAPEYQNEFSFSSLDVTSNIFLSGEVATWFSYFVVRPHGAGHFINGLNISGNRFRSINGYIDRVERVDTSFANLAFQRMRNVNVSGNSFHGVSTSVQNPYRFSHNEAAVAQTWVIDAGEGLPFGGWALNVDSLVAKNTIRNAANQVVDTMPYIRAQQGPNNDQIHLIWDQPVRGTVQLTVRMDNDV
ncbi:hypothetical protein C1J03_20045 [Sulfitobacter sp. SK012]|uniref:glycosyl hydrolase family 28-related protein n=1 Tax=Sulfitobacter sp. SK012 TaxID=1389005 RepID=UPI000E09FD0C|nr:glycosyl hydrolase family 28-related protein [Sulfitobacter sp. SK012]AXI48087.1 hypothetical protein C1J03_20045 [Sulfitobacter sp. SK012]